MKNAIKSLAFAAFVMAFAACKNETASSNSAAVSAPVTAATEQAVAQPTATTPAPAATTPAPTAAATVEKVAPNAVQAAATKTPAAAPATTATTTAKTTAMKFDNLNHDWGTIKEGEKMTHVFKFKNTGTNDLIISDARGSCGCTVPEWPKEPIKPGKSGEMKVVFDSNGKAGDQQKTVTVTANTEPSTMMLSIKGKVTAKEGATN